MVLLTCKSEYKQNVTEQRKRLEKYVQYFNVQTDKPAKSSRLLKVDSNENLGGTRKSLSLSFCLGLWQSRVICSLNMSFLFKIHFFRFRLRLINRRCPTEKGKRWEFCRASPFSLAQPIGDVKKMKLFPAALTFLATSHLRSALPFQDVKIHKAEWQK